MGRGGGGSSGRSSGGGSFGGSRSSGGFRGGGSSHRGGYSSSRPSSSSFSSHSSGVYHPRPPRPPRPPRHDVVHVHHYGSPYYGSGVVRSSSAYASPGQALKSLLSIAFVIFFMACVFFVITSINSSNNVTKSTVVREKLDAQYVTTTDYYYDNAGWISSGARLESGLKHFYKETGVQPFLYITETVDGATHPTDEQMDAFANALYDELFADEGHVLVVFQEYNSDSQYFCYAVAGKMAKTVFDNEARSILFDYIDHCYYSNMDEESFFSNAFEDTADRMMTVTKSPLPRIIISVVGLIIVIIAFVWWNKAKEQRNKEAEHTERILNADLGEKMGSSEVNELEKKYQDE